MKPTEKNAPRCRDADNHHHQERRNPMPSSGFAILNLTDINTLAEAIADGRVSPEALEKIQKACALCVQKQIAKAGQVDAWPSDMATAKPSNALLIRQHIAHGHR